MPLPNTDDSRSRLRRAPEQPRHRYIDDFHGHSADAPQHAAGFPRIGSTLRTYQGQQHSEPAAVQSQPAPRLQTRSAPLPPLRPRPDIRPATIHTPTFTSPALAPAATPDARSAAKPKKVKKHRRIFTKKRVIVALVLLILGVGGYVGGKFLYNSAKVFHGSVFSVLSTTKLKGEDTGRVNFLLAGNSADDPGHDGANLTDSIMLISIDTKDNTAFMLSIPRDLWVDIPGYGHAKINEAYVDGQTGNFSAAGYPSGGMGLLEEVVQQNFGIDINYYALIDYNAFRDAVNAVGGIDINVQSEDPRGLYDPSIDWSTHGPLVKLTNGEHHLTGEQALDLARARGDAYGSYGFPQSDFDRTAHQRQMLLALKTKIFTAGVLANPVALGRLFDALGANVRTDMTLSEARRLYDLGKNINNSKIQSVSLNNVNGSNLLANYTSPTHQTTLITAAGIDDFSQIQQLLQQLTSNNPVVKEGAQVVVLNGTTTDGLAGQAETALKAKSITVTAIGDASANTATTTIIDASGGTMPATLSLLKQLYGTNVTTTNPYANTYDADFIVILGSDRVQNTAAAAQ